jgi:hypothetical protein
MARLFKSFCAVIALALLMGSLRAAEKAANDNKPQRGEVTNVDTGAGTLTVKLRDQDGKEVEKTFKLTGEAKFYRADGQATELNAFRSGDQIVLLARKGAVSELRQAGKPVRAEILDMDPSTGTVRVKMKDENGKEVEKTYKLTGEIRYMDSLGRAATAKVFRAGDQVAVIVNKGQLQEISQVKR